MRFPLITDYIDSIKFSENNFAKFTDLQPMVDDNGTPIYIRENSCVLFKMKDIVSNKIYFVKCFLEDQAGRNEWYNNIVQSNLFYPQHESCYLPDELFVDTEVSESEEFPVFILLRCLINLFSTWRTKSNCFWFEYFYFVGRF